ncbi:MAG: AraC family transcriptional regulator [Polyangiales bacterium]
MVLDVDRVRLPAFVLSDTLARGTSAWHAHHKHQLLYATSGVLELECDDGTYLLPPQRAALIRGGVRHRVRSKGKVELRTIYFAPSTEMPEGDCRVFAVPDVLREMIVHAARYGPSTPHDRTARAFFRAIVALLPEVARDRHAYRLPSKVSPLVGRVLELLEERLDEPMKIAQLARRCAMSVRTFERHLRNETGTGCRELLQRMRMQRAMELLSVRGARVTQVALSVGFESVSSFSRTFAKVTGERPSDFVKSAVQVARRHSLPSSRSAAVQVARRHSLPSSRSR